MTTTMLERGKTAKKAGIQLSATDTQTRSAALTAIADALEKTARRSSPPTRPIMSAAQPKTWQRRCWAA